MSKKKGQQAMLALWQRILAETAEGLVLDGIFRNDLQAEFALDVRV